MDASSREKLLEALKHSIPKKQIFENAPHEPLYHP